MVFTTGFAGAFFGALSSILLIIGGFIVWDYWTQCKDNTRKAAVPPPAEVILEKQLEQYLITHFERLFPGWRIFGAPLPQQEENPASEPTSSKRAPGIRYRTKAGEIDLLCYDPKGNLVVIELKRDKAPDRVVAQVDRYIAWVKTNVAQPGQKVWGLIIARRMDARLFHILKRRRDIRIWTYQWRLHFNKRPKPL